MQGTARKFKTQLICSKCECEDVTVFGEKSRDGTKSSLMRSTVTKVRCDQCGHWGPTSSFFRIRLSRKGLQAVHPEVQYTSAGRTYKGELQGTSSRGYWFVGMRREERLEGWLSRSEIVLLQ